MSQIDAKVSEKRKKKTAKVEEEVNFTNSAGMNLRPRCRDWLPLSTQQLRLRNLARIQGVNIECVENDDALIYYTLHSDKESSAFYTSEKLPQRHLQQKWAEIDAGDAVRKSNANCVCVKVWASWQQDKAITETETELKQMAIMPENRLKSKEPESALTKQLANVCLTPNKLPRPPERLLFAWGVYFSGLMPLSEPQETKWKPNSLLFFLNGEYFTSPEQFTTDGLRDQLSLNYQRYAASVPKVNPSNCDEFSINSPSVSRSSSPVGLDKNNDLLQMSKTRYMTLKCDVIMVRRSYDLKKLLKIQELQRLQLQKMRDCADITINIKQLSVRCITRSELRCKPRTTSFSMSGTTQSHQYHSMGRTLSVLLAEQQQIEPLALYNAQQLQTQVETLRCKKRLLQTEHATYAKRIAEKRQRLEELKLARSELKQFLKQQLEQLKDDRAKRLLLEQELQMQKQERRNIVLQVERGISTLCLELREIYNITRLQTDVYSICGIVIPNIGAYMGDTRHVSHLALENTSPLALSAALGYIAHMVQMIAIIINRPLRNPILYETSRSRIMDVVKNLPYTSREFPLYTRSALPTKPVKYAIYLLNQNIAQLCFDITGRRCELRSTFENILHIFKILAAIEHNQREIHSEYETLPCQRLELTDEVDKGPLKPQQEHEQRYHPTPVSNGDSAENFSKSHSSVDVAHVPVPPVVEQMLPFRHLLSPSSGSQPLAIDGFATTQRCRSVGSYSDCEEDFKDIIEHTYSNSDSNITFQSKRS